MINVSKKEKRGKVGRPPSVSDTLPIQKIYDILPHDGSRMQYVRIREQAKKRDMGFDTLQRYLSYLENKGQIVREIDTTTRPPSVYYRRGNQELFPLGEKFYKLMVREMPDVMEEILSCEDKEDLKERLILLLDTDFAAMIFLLSKAIQNAVTKKDPHEALEYINLVCKLNLEPWIKGLTLTCWGAKDASLDAIDYINKSLADIAASESEKLKQFQDEHISKLNENDQNPN